MNASLFHPVVARWFHERYQEPTEAQRLSWPRIMAGEHTLVAAPTGSGKTFAAFLVAIDRLLRQAAGQSLPDEVQVVYVSPLKALSNDIRRNLQIPLHEIQEAAETAGYQPKPIRICVRTGDTPAGERQAMLRRPPHILVTTPESLYLLLTGSKSREILRNVRTVIVDEIHALARDKRGSHLSLSLARLDRLCTSPPVRVGLSATQRPMDAIARFLVGTPNVAADGQARCHVVDTGHVRELDLAVEVPPSELSAVCPIETWKEVYARLAELIREHRSTLVFVNTRRLAERVCHYLEEELGPGHVTSHHGSLSRETRLLAEEKLKAGELKAIVATASLELGIDIGYIDLVCQIGSPRSIGTFLQRVGRAGHALGRIPKGRLFAMTRDELLESLALIGAVRRGQLDRIVMPAGPLDILAQQIVAAAAGEDWDEDDLLAMCRAAWPYHDLRPEDFDAVVAMLSDGIAPGNRSGAYLHRDQINRRLRGRRNARIAAITSGGAIPEQADYRVVTEDGTFVGTLNEDFAIESQAGNVFQLGNSSWRIHHIRTGVVTVSDAHGAPANVPFWLGEAPGRTDELSAELSSLRETLWQAATGNADFGFRISDCGLSERPSVGAPANLSAVNRRNTLASSGAVNDDIAFQGNGRKGLADDTLLDHTLGGAQPAAAPDALASGVDWLKAQCGADDWGARQAINYVAAQGAALGVVPTRRQVVFERFFDESGGMELVIHAPFGARINRAWGLALRKCFCRTFDFELQASADDNGIVLSIGPNHSFPIEQLFDMLNSRNGEKLLVQALLAVPMFGIRWRWNVTRALAVLRQRGGKKVPPPIQRFRADDLLTAVFPMQTACFEHRTGDLEPPDHPLINQTVHDCLHEAMDLNGWNKLLDEIAAGDVQLVARDSREPSPFSHQLLNANPYAFLDDAPLEERRARAVSARRTISVDDVRDLAQLDPAAIAEVRSEAWPLVRDAEELHETLLTVVALSEDEAADWHGFFAELVAAGRATKCQVAHGPMLWIAAESWPVIRAALPVTARMPDIVLPERLERDVSAEEAAKSLVRGRVEISGPTNAARIAKQLGLNAAAVDQALLQLEAEGCILRGRFTQETDGTEWCERRLLARIHRRTLDGLRRQIQPVDTASFFRFLLERHGLGTTSQPSGLPRLQHVIAALQGFEAPAGAWEHDLLPARVKEYAPEQLDELFTRGEVMWGRLQPPRQTDDSRGRVLTRIAPISLVRRTDLNWLLPPEREISPGSARWDAQTTYEALTAHGALFFDDLLAATRLLPAQLEDALRELAALGLVTSDGFAAVRATIVKHGPTEWRTASRVRRRRHRRAAYAHSGRWSKFPPYVQPPNNDERTERWAWLLLERYGVLFRDLLTRESLAPSWRELVSVFRRLEMRGEIRGGRFVAGVAGEQFAVNDAVERLRQLRDETPEHELMFVSATDPLNLIGIITRDARVPATRSNRVLFLAGQPVAASESRHIRWLAELDGPTRQRAIQLLLGPDTLRRQELAAETDGLFSCHGAPWPSSGVGM
jgi:ATP-dependent Lhr-like helicase